jgi:electron transfer flavoprotein alpha subunit
MILVPVDVDRGVLDPISLQALTFARTLDTDVQAVVPADASVAVELGEYGASVVHVAENPGLVDYAPQAIARAVVQLAAATSPTAIVAAGTARGNEVMAHVAAILDAPLATDCVAVSLASPFEVTRARWAGNLLEESSVTTDVLLATVLPHSVLAEPAPASGTVVPFAADLTDGDIAVRVIERAGAAAAGVTLVDAKAVISGGRGMGGPEAFAMLDELAALLGGTVGCSRVVTSEGWRPHAEQVGQTGTKVAPDLYIACGISGATQHLAGCKNSKTIVAINTDAQAPMMLAADYAVVGDIHAFLPVLIAQTRAASAG